MFIAEVQKDRAVCEIVAAAIDEHNQGDYYLQLASDIIHLQYCNDQRQLDDLWSAYGYRDCFRAMVYVRMHEHERPTPRVVPGEFIEENIPMVSIDVEDLRPIEELLPQLDPAPTAGDCR